VSFEGTKDKENITMIAAIGDTLISTAEQDAPRVKAAVKSKSRGFDVEEFFVRGYIQRTYSEPPRSWWASEMQFETGARTKRIDEIIDVLSMRATTDGVLR
jgi:hypothetical protein